jgi:hypothetical protein
LESQEYRLPGLKVPRGLVVVEKVGKLPPIIRAYPGSPPNIRFDLWERATFRIASSLRSIIRVRKTVVLFHVEHCGGGLHNFLCGRKG